MPQRKQDQAAKSGLQAVIVHTAVRAVTQNHSTVIITTVGIPLVHPHHRLGDDPEPIAMFLREGIGDTGRRL